MPDDSLEEECSTDLPPEKKLSAVHTQYVQKVILRQLYPGHEYEHLGQGVVKYQNFSTPGSEKYFRRSALFRSRLDGFSEQFSLLEPGQ